MQMKVKSKRPGDNVVVGPKFSKIAAVSPLESVKTVSYLGESLPRARKLNKEHA